MNRAKDSGDKEKLKELSENKRNFSRSKKTYYNAVNASGDVVVLELSKKASDALDKKIVEAVQEKKFDPLSLKTGVWFRFTRTGMSLDTVIEVEFKRIQLEQDGEILEKLDRTPLKPETLEGIESKVTDIFNPEKLWIRTLSAKDLAGYLRGEALDVSIAGSLVAASVGKRAASLSARETRDPVEDVFEQIPVPAAGATKSQATIYAPTVSANSGATAAGSGGGGSMSEELARLRSLRASMGTGKNGGSTG
jgi:hypothetical protein